MCLITSVRTADDCRDINEFASFPF